MPRRSARSTAAATAVAFAVAVASAACGPPPDAALSDDFEVQGPLRLIDDGVFDLSVTCGRVARTMPIGHAPACDLGGLRAMAGELQLISPWRDRTRGVLEGGRVRFHVNWSATGIDPLSDDATARLDGVWQVQRAGSDTVYQSWRADAEAINLIRHHIGAATDTQYELRRGGPPPTLVVVGVAPGKPLRSGETTSLAITLANQGPGDAYMVTAETRSSLPALHGLRFSFGTIPAGATKMRAATVNVPRSTVETSAMLVIAFTEGNDQVPDNASRRLAIEPANDAPVLSASCRIADREPDGKVAGAGEPAADAVPLVDAGATLRVRCRVENTGASARGIWLSATITGGRAPATSPASDLPGDSSADLELRLQVPRSARMDQRLDVAITLEIPYLERRLTQELAVQVARPRVCPEGKLTRAEYQSKLAELQKALEAGALTQAELDSYDAELVSCLE